MISLFFLFVMAGGLCAAIRGDYQSALGFFAISAIGCVICNVFIDRDE